MVDAGTVRAWAVAAARALAAARTPIDSLNVFPVPDGDTGTNLALTVAEAAEHLGDAGAGRRPPPRSPPPSRAGRCWARGATPGVIVSQYLQGFARGLAADDAPDAALLARALQRGAAGRAGGGRPAGRGDDPHRGRGRRRRPPPPRPRDGADIRATASAAVAGARDALARSPQALEVLRAAGVVDAGATGLVVLLGALAGVLGSR